jgi:methionine-gamma-lyase
MPPVELSATFEFEEAAALAKAFSDLHAGKVGDFPYSRNANPTVRVLEEWLAGLEGAEDAVATGSGMGAISATMLALAGAGDRLAITRHVYGGTYALARNHLARLGIEVRLFDLTSAEGIAEMEAWRPSVCHLESPGNPTLEITDLAAAAAAAHRAGAIVLCDNTFATPIHQRPLAFGVEVVLHATTKLIAGHGDAIGGAAAGSRDLIRRIRQAVIDLGPTPSPFTAYLTLRGGRTLQLRCERQAENALEVARALEGRAGVRVFYPGLPSHPQHGLAARQMQGYGSMIALLLDGGVDAGRRLLDGLQLARRAVSLGDLSTLVTHPASTTHSNVDVEQRLAAGIADGLVRVSVGLEDPREIAADLARTLG